MQWISPWYYGNEAVSINQWETIESIECAPTDETCFRDGNDILDYYSFTVSHIKANLSSSYHGDH